MNFRLHPLIFAGALGAAAAVAAAPAVPGLAGRTLEKDLTYFRLHHLPGDLPAAPPGGALVVDLRFVAADDAAVASFAHWLQAHAGRETPVFVLIDRATAPALRAELAPAHAPAGEVSIGPAEGAPPPDVALDVTPEADRAAYESLENGTPLAQVVHPKVDKTRYDEAAMARQRAAENGNAPLPD